MKSQFYRFLRILDLKNFVDLRDKENNKIRFFFSLLNEILLIFAKKIFFFHQEVFFSQLHFFLFTNRHFLEKTICIFSHNYFQIFAHILRCLARKKCIFYEILSKSSLSSVIILPCRDAVISKGQNMDSKYASILSKYSHHCTHFGEKNKPQLERFNRS